MIKWNDYNDGTISELVPNDLIDFQDGSRLLTMILSLYHGIDWMSWWDVNSKNETGTAVILCGNKEDEDTLNHLIIEGKNFLQSRYLKYDVIPMFARRGYTPSRQREIRDQSVHDPLSTLNETSFDKGTIIYKSWKLHYFIADKNFRIQLIK